jgi:hypothetical protein
MRSPPELRKFHGDMAKDPGDSRSTEARLSVIMPGDRDLVMDMEMHGKDG